MYSHSCQLSDQWHFTQDAINVKPCYPAKHTDAILFNSHVHVNIAYSYIDTDTGVRQRDSAEYRESLWPRQCVPNQTPVLLRLDFLKNSYSHMFVSLQRTQEKGRTPVVKTKRRIISCPDLFGELDYLTDKTDDEFWRQVFKAFIIVTLLFLNLF